MNSGVVLFAFNSPDYDYVRMAEFSAKRVRYFLNLPCTIITDKKSSLTINSELFDKIIIVDNNSTNQIDGRIWLNKGRYQAYELSPYDQTLLLDVDYIINSEKLKTILDIMDDFMCHDTITYQMMEHNKKEFLSSGLSIPILWATVIAFKKTKRVKQIFECLKMVQENYEHYANIHKFSVDTYRNDYALTLAWRIVNGHLHVERDIIPWNLLHIHPKTRLYKTSLEEYDTNFVVTYDKHLRDKFKKEYIQLKSIDFHVIDKKDLSEIINNG